MTLFHQNDFNQTWQIFLLFAYIHAVFIAVYSPYVGQGKPC